VGRRIFSIQTQRQASQTGTGKTSDGLAGDQRRCRGRHGDAQSLVTGVRDDVEDVGSLRRISACKDKQRIRRAERFDALNQSLRFLKTKLGSASLRIRFRPAMQTGEIAGARRLPDYGERPLIKIH